MGVDMSMDSRYRGDDDVAALQFFWMFPRHVIPAQAGIQSLHNVFPTSRGVDSRLRGNDEQRDPIYNGNVACQYSLQLQPVRFNPWPTRNTSRFSSKA
jgi:hypothetical protein